MKRAILFFTSLIYLIVCLFCVRIPIVCADDTEKEGMQYMKEKQYLAAAQCFETVLREDKDNTIVQRNLARVYNAYACEKMEEGAHLEAIYYTTQAIEFDPTDQIIRDNVSIAYLNFAHACLDEGNYDDAYASFEKAKKYCTNLEKRKKPFGVLLYELALASFNKKHYPQAKKYLVEAEQYVPQNGYIFNLKGDIAYYEQDLIDAELFYVQALADPDLKEKNKKEINEKIVKLKKEKKVEEKLTAQKAENFIIRYDKEQVEVSSYMLRSILNEAYRKVGQDFSYFPKSDIVVIVYNAEEFDEQSEGGSGGIRALYDGKIRVPALSNRMRQNEFKGLVYHEFTHALIHEMAGTACPTWLHEGLAQYEQDSVMRVSPAVLNNALRSGAIIPVSSFFTSVNQGIPGDDVDLFYAESFSLVSYLVKRYGMYDMKKLFNRLNEGEEFSQAFQKVFYLNAGTLQKRWLKHLGR